MQQGARHFFVRPLIFFAKKAKVTEFDSKNVSLAPGIVKKGLKFVKPRRHSHQNPSIKRAVHITVGIPWAPTFITFKKSPLEGRGPPRKGQVYVFFNVALPF